MKIKLADHMAMYPSWAGKLFLWYVGVGLAVVLFFSDEAIKSSSYMVSLIDFISGYLPGIRVRVNDFYFVRRLYLCVMLIAMPITLMILLARDQTVPRSTVYGSGACKFVLLSVLSFFLVWLFFCLVYYKGLQHSSFSISKGRILDVLFNYSRIGMAVTGAAYFGFMVLFSYYSVMSLIFSYKKLKGDFE